MEGLSIYDDGIRLDLHSSPRHELGSEEEVLDGLYRHFLVVLVGETELYVAGDERLHPHTVTEDIAYVADEFIRRHVEIFASVAMKVGGGYEHIPHVVVGIML